MYNNCNVRLINWFINLFTVKKKQKFYASVYGYEVDQLIFYGNFQSQLRLALGQFKLSNRLIHLIDRLIH